MKHQLEPREGFFLESEKSKVQSELPFPSEAFAEAWREWTQHRTEIKHQLTPTSAKKQLKTLLDMGEDRAIAAIGHSIEKGYQGIFEPSAPRANEQPAISTQPGTTIINGRAYKSKS